MNNEEDTIYVFGQTNPSIDIDLLHDLNMTFEEYMGWGYEWSNGANFNGGTDGNNEDDECDGLGGCFTIIAQAHHFYANITYIEFEILFEAIAFYEGWSDEGQCGATFEEVIACQQPIVDDLRQLSGEIDGLLAATILQLEALDQGQAAAELAAYVAGAGSLGAAFIPGGQAASLILGGISFIEATYAYISEFVENNYYIPSVLETYKNYRNEYYDVVDQFEQCYEDVSCAGSTVASADSYLSGTEFISILSEIEISILNFSAEETFL